MSIELPTRTRLAARVGSAAALFPIPAFALAITLDLLDAPLQSGLLYLAGLSSLMVGFPLSFVLPRPLTVDPLVVDSPVAGRWLALNSPATKVPSHGTHAYGQTYAVDLVHAPEGVERPTFGDGSHLREPEDYPAFGQPLHCVADGVVVRVVDRWRDHRSRSSWPAYLLMMVEGMVREFGGPGPILGNHVIIRLSDGTYVLYAHLRRGSVQVGVGQRVTAGERLAECGNTGNSSEPHLHLQRMDHPRPLLAQGLPWAIRGGAADGGDGLPASTEALEGVPATGRTGGPTSGRPEGPSALDALKQLGDQRRDR
ncbi:M23 family metallopeptidase [Actinotalea sp. K2]|uniref:M23 family metallopeptidase n=1 Tax=Actinotalea sp. K2 TaxID=2939438 RepID=UPI002016D8C5|nr:M23 family metallopeptidase [Actinotalea sp. K2]MCL3862565.1 M23 family metallopeptidase [Actinotalea sp. K2]